MTGLIAIANEGLIARINPLGAELWSLADRDGREYLTDADPAFWTGRAPLLFPIVGALNGGRYRVDGNEHALPKHGFARTSRFELAELARSYSTGPRVGAYLYRGVARIGAPGARHPRA